MNSSHSYNTQYPVFVSLSMSISLILSSLLITSCLFFRLIPNLVNSLHSSSLWYSNNKVLSFITVELLTFSMPRQPQYSSYFVLLNLQFSYSIIVFIWLFIKLCDLLWHTLLLLHWNLFLWFFFHKEEYLNLSFVLEWSHVVLHFLPMKLLKRLKYVDALAFKYQITHLYY